MLRSLLKEVVEQRRTLLRVEAREALDAMLQGAASEVEMAAMLAAMAVRGETAAELAGFADGLRAVATPLPLSDAERARLVDTCGTGGDGLGTFNISTGAALVASAAGALVAKHGNRAVTSKSGSADVLEALGVPVELSADQSVDCLRATGFMFLYAPALRPAMARLAPVRRALGFRTIFNVVGPLTNPAGALAQVMGVWTESQLPVVAEAMELLGVRRAFVVHGDGLDELTVSGTSHAVEVNSGAPPRRFTLEPEELGLVRAPVSALGGGGSAAESAAILLAIFNGEQRGAAREVVLLNAAAALVAGGVAENLQDGIHRAGAAIDDGAALDLIARLRSFRAQP
jgi:anthranilate phosphoribosyltransferase